MAKSLFHCLAGSVAVGLALATPAPIERRAPAIALAEHTMQLSRNFISREGRMRPFHRQLMSVVDYAGGEPVAIGSGVVRAEQMMIEYVTDVKVGNDSYDLIVDTGSSDTWIVKHNFQCFNPRSEPCLFGKKFTGEFPLGKILNQHLNITYGYSGGPNMIGDMGYADLGVANITVPKQQIGLVTKGRWRGDNITSGILGLGLPGLTDSFTGEELNTAREGAGLAVPYAPLITTVAKTVSAVFALALHRDKAKSFLSFGGIPAGIKTTGEWATAPLKKVELRSGGSEYLYYQIGVEKIFWNGSAPTQAGTDSRPPDFIVDSGTTLNMFPEALAVRINNAFTPRAIYDQQYGQWFVRCDAKAPQLGIQIGGKMFMTDPTSMILPEVMNDAKFCATGIGITNGWPYILGDTFMQGLINVFDTTPEKMEMRFAQRA